jgi:MFS family permease
VDLTPVEQRGRWLGYTTLVNPIGVAIGPALGGILEAEVGYVSPLFLTSRVLALLGLLCAAQVHDPMVGATVVPDHSSSSREQSSFWLPLQQRAFLIPTLTLLLVGITFGSIASFVPLFIRQVSPTLNVGAFYTAAAIASFSIRIFVGKASDRLGRGVFITLGLLCYGISMGVLCTAENEWAFLAAGFSEGCGGGILIPTMAALIADRSPKDSRGSLFSLCMAGFDLGIAIAGPMLGTVVRQMGYQQLYGLTGMGMGLAIVIFMTGNNRTVKQSLAFACGQGKDAYAEPMSTENGLKPLNL